MSSAWFIVAPVTLARVEAVRLELADHLEPNDANRFFKGIAAWW